MWHKSDVSDGNRYNFLAFVLDRTTKADVSHSQGTFPVLLTMSCFNYVQIAFLNEFYNFDVNIVGTWDSSIFYILYS